MACRLPGLRPDGFRSRRLLRVAPVVALVLLTLLLAACGADETSPMSTIPQEGDNNERIWDVYWILWIGAAIVFVLVESLLVYTIWRYRHRPRMAHGRPVPVHGNTKLEIIWTVIPAIVIAAIGIPTLQIIADLADTPNEDQAVRVEVVGHQFFFEFRYPDEGGISVSNTLHIPEDTTIDLYLTSEDVIHSFWVPQLAGKTDTIPGRTNRMWLTANDPGTYAGQCAEFCGTGHALMRFQVEVHTAEDYAAWLEEAKNPSAAGAAGQQIAQANGCTGCHSVDGAAGVGPTWQGLVGSEITLADGSTVTADEAYITESIHDPNAKIHEGFPSGVMPAFPQLTDEDIAALIDYMETLGGPAQ